METPVLQNPENIAPEEIIRDQVAISVNYLDFRGEQKKGVIVAHNLVAQDITEFFSHALELKFPIEKIIPISEYAWDDERSCEDNNSSGFNFRKIGGSTKMSKHSLGCAFDINPKQNVYIRYDEAGNEVYRLPKNSVYSPDVEGSLSSRHTLVLFMKEKGWTWGGDWTPDTGRVDYQHFEIVPNELELFLN